MLENRYRRRQLLIEKLSAADPRVYGAQLGRATFTSATDGLAGGWGASFILMFYLLQFHNFLATPYPPAILTHPDDPGSTSFTRILTSISGIPPCILGYHIFCKL